MLPLDDEDAKKKLGDQKARKSAGTVETINFAMSELEARAGIEPTYKDLQSSA